MIIYYTDKYAGSRDESHRLLKKALAVHTGDEKKAKTLVGAMKKGEHGKPFIEGFSCFSISHTGSIWAVLIADRECGLDIQLGRKCNRKPIADRWFAPEDAASLDDLLLSDSKSAYDAFFRIWTRREALTKALGSTVYDPGLPAVRTERVHIGGKQYSLMDIAFPHVKDCSLSDLYAAVCIEGSFSGLKPEFRMMEERIKEKKNKTAIETAYKFLASRMRTTEEVRKHLESKGYNKDEINDAINELIGMRYLDDYLFALRYYEYNHEKKRGVLRAERELMEKGIERDTVRNAKEDFLYEHKVNEFEDALDIALKEVFVSSDIYGEPPVMKTVDDRLTAKIARKLEGNGFSKGDIFRVLESIRREAKEFRDE